MKTGLFFLEISGNQELNTNIFEKYLNISHGNSKFSSFCFKQIERGGGGLRSVVFAIKIGRL